MIKRWIENKAQRMKQVADDRYITLPHQWEQELRELVYLERSRLAIIEMVEMVCIVALWLLGVHLLLAFIFQLMILYVSIGVFGVLSFIGILVYLRVRHLRYRYQDGWISAGGVYHEF